MQHITRTFAFLARHKRWLLVLSAIPLFEVVTAFGVSPDTVTQNVPQTTVVADVALPEPAQADSGAFDFWREERIQSGDTLASLLDRLGVGPEDMPGALAASRGHAARLIAGRTILAKVTSGGRLLLFRYLIDDSNLLTIERAGDGFVAKDEVIQPETQVVMRSGEIKYSLFGATDAADVPDSIASQMAEVFSGDIDFHRDIRQGDRFSVVYEVQYQGGRALRTGRLLAAEFVNQGHAYRAVYFRDPQGRESYFTPDGKSMKRAFLKSPIPFSRISSGFSSARYHPVLKEWRAHKGIDYAAPTGTPVRAVSDAKVAFVGRKGGYGNLIVLRHQGPYSTAYGHLSRFAKGLRNGARVSQGDIIGYVGATGLATGPHLHYEFRVNDVQKNPLAVRMPAAYPLEARYRAQFGSAAAPLVSQLNLLQGRNLTSLD
ncbi:M23 family peptidase [Parasulfuritortus cantonensis]|uniref:M23 family peptidase n=1 Tax=Parasulfuritortus cantonensis TaxID=2528202 RepID=A0A4R1BGQ2_9PROT|nr:peptidoglycan DD-metalloendopeptidase family protein [Parasulfuritortus cantonensis]TCJ16334.1 M23 family peptidase [Parasulfuritortus cantonensis]